MNHEGTKNTKTDKEATGHVTMPRLGLGVIQVLQMTFCIDCVSHVPGGTPRGL
jgi:hypothetical protein